MFNFQCANEVKTMRDGADHLTAIPYIRRRVPSATTCPVRAAVEQWMAVGTRAGWDRTQGYCVFPHIKAGADRHGQSTTERIVLRYHPARPHLPVAWCCFTYLAVPKVVLRGGERRQGPRRTGVLEGEKAFRRFLRSRFILLAFQSISFQLAPFHHGYCRFRYTWYVYARY